MVKGLASSFAGQEIHLLTYSDHITETMNEAAVDTVGPDGSFKLELKHYETLPVKFVVGRAEAHLYLEPDQQYDIEFPLLDEGMANRPEALVAAVKINHEGDSRLNAYWRSLKE